MSKMKLVIFALLSCALFGCEREISDNLPFTMAKKTYEDNHFSESLLHVRRSIQLYPKHSESRLLIAKVLLKLGRAQEAEQQLEMALTLGLPLSQTIVWQGLALIKQEKYDEVLQKLDMDNKQILHGLSIHDHATLYALIGQAQMAKTKLNDSLNSFNRAIMIDEECGLAYVGLAAVNLNKQKDEKGIEYLHRAFEIDEKDVYAWALKGDIERIQKKFKEAEKSYSKVIEYSYPLSIENQYARFGRALTQAYQADFEDAWKDIRKIKLNRENDLNLYYVSGVISFLEKDYTKAQGEWEKVLEIDPNHSLSRHLLDAIQSLQAEKLASQDIISFILEGKKRALPLDNLPETIGQLPYGMMQLKLDSYL